MEITLSLNVFHLLPVDLHETLPTSADAGTSSTSFENLPEIQLSNGARPKFEFPTTLPSAGWQHRRRRIRSSSIGPMQHQLPVIQVSGDGEERLRELRRTISARPQTSTVLASSDDDDDSSSDEIRVCDVQEDVDNDDDGVDEGDDLSFFTESDASDSDSGSRRNPPSSYPYINPTPSVL